MLSTLISLIIRLIAFILNMIINLILTLFPSFGIDRVSLYITGFFGLIANAVQLTYFIVGPAMYIFTDIIIALFFAKHIILPIINFMRKIVIH